MEKAKTPIEINDSEWEIMWVTWTLRQTAAQEIVQILTDSMDWRPATVKTLLRHLVKKEVIWTEQEGKEFIYHPTVPEMETVRSTTEDLFSHICAKKIGETIADLVERATLAQEDINGILEQLEQK